MKKQKFVISGLLSVGFLALLAAVSPILSPNPNADQKAITWGGLGIGAVCFGLAGYLVWQIKSPREEGESTPTVIQIQTPAPKPTSQPTVIQPQTPAPKQTSQPTVIQTQPPAPKQTSQPTVIQSQTPAPKQISQPTVIQPQTPAPKQISQPTVIQTQPPAPKQTSQPTVIQTQPSVPKQTSQPTVIQTQPPAPKQPKSSALIPTSQPTSSQKSSSALTPPSKPTPTQAKPPASETNKNFNPLDLDLLHSLETALKQQQWQEADKITAQLMLKAANQTIALTPEDLASFPRESLSEIDRLWQIYSQNKFGFLAQIEIFNDCFGAGNTPASLNSENWQKYAQRLGWYQTQWPNHHHELNFSLTAPKGHLPFLPVWYGAWWGGFLAGQGQRFYTFIKRAQSCRLATHLDPQPLNNQSPSAPNPEDPFTALGGKINDTFKKAKDTIAKGTGLSQD